MRRGSLARVPRSPLPIGGSSLEVPSQYGSKLYQSAIPSLSALPLLPLTRLCMRWTGWRWTAHPPRAPTRSRLDRIKGAVILNPYYLVHLMCETANCRAQSRVRTRVISVVRALRFHAGCVLSQDISSFGRIDPILAFESHGYFRPDLAFMRRKLSRHFPTGLGRVI